MKRFETAFGLALVVSLAGTAREASAQTVTAVEGEGYPVGEGTVIHPTLGGEIGFTDNVFYGDIDQNGTGRFASGILRLVAEAAIASKEIPPEEPLDPLLDEGAEEPAEPAHQSVIFRAGGRLAYTEYLSLNNAVRSQRNLSADLNGSVVLAPEGTVSFSAEDRLVRDTRPTNFESFENTNRIANLLALGLKYQPGGHQINAGLRWENQIDYFEASSQSFANRMNNFIHLRGEWNFFPYSKAFADASYGFIGGLGDSSFGGMAYKHSAQPIRGGVGIATAITELFTVKAHVGWAYASYGGGASYNSPMLGAELGYRYSPVGRVVFGYSWDHFDSINADYYTDHGLSARVDHQIGARIIADAHADLKWRGYRGVPMALGGGTNRDDLLFAVGADVQYVLKDWLEIVANYRTEADNTSYEQTVGLRDNPSYVRTEITAGVRAAL